MAVFKPNIYLSNMGQAYFQEPGAYVAESMFPMIPVVHQSSYYRIFDKADLARDNVQVKPQFGSVEPSGYSITDGKYSCEVYQIIAGIDQIAERALLAFAPQGVFDPRIAKVRYVVEQMKTHLDVLFAKSFFKDDVWPATWSGDGAIDDQFVDSAKKFQYFNNTDSNPVLLFDHLKTEILRAGRRKPNKLALGVNTFYALKNNETILSMVKYTGTTLNPGVVTEKTLAEAFGVDEVKVFASTYNKAAKGQPADMDFICDPNGALLCYAPKTPAIDEPSAGYIFNWDVMGTGRNPMYIQDVFPVDTDHVEKIEGLYALDMKITGADLGVYLKNCVSES